MERMNDKERLDYLQGMIAGLSFAVRDLLKQCDPEVTDHLRVRLRDLNDSQKPSPLHDVLGTKPLPKPGTAGAKFTEGVDVVVEVLFDPPTSS